MTLWHGRFKEPMDAALWELSESFSFDRSLYAHDVRASDAHVGALVDAGLLSEEEGASLRNALGRVLEEFRTGAFVSSPTDEDIHTAIERRVTEIAGEVGAKLHTARSRNDQIATTLRLFTRDAIGDVVSDVLDLVDALVAAGDRYRDAYLPGYTHLQRAQPVLWTHHLNAHAFALLRDVDRLFDARERLNVSPLGAGALAGSPFALDPAATAAALGFESAFANSMDAVSDRDFVAETLFALALLGVHLSRMGEELVLWTTREFGFASLSDAFTTGSSMLPQKKNSDVAELARGKSGRLVGNLVTLLVVLKGLPLTYNRDLQEDKEPLFDSLRHVRLVLRALAGAFGDLTLHLDVARRAAEDDDLVAIDIADELVIRGVPFRRAHEIVGELVARANDVGAPLRDLVSQSEELRIFSPLFAPGASLNRRRSPGASGPAAQGEQAQRLRATLAHARDRLA